MPVNSFPRIAPTHASNGRESVNPTAARLVPTTGTSAREASVDEEQTIVYDPLGDDYDVRTASIKPASWRDQEDEILTRKQIAALHSRIAKGGNESVLNHYKSVVLDMEKSLAALSKYGGNTHGVKPALEHHCSHKRIGSGDSTLSTASTRCPEGIDLYDRLQVDSEASMPIVAWGCSTQQQGNAIRGVPSIAWGRHPVSCTTQTRRIEHPPAISRNIISSSATAKSASTPQILGHAKPTRIGMTFGQTALARSPLHTGGPESIWTRSPPPPLRQWLGARGSIHKCCN